MGYQGPPIVGFMGNHNLSVNITNIAGNVNAIRSQQFFEEDIKTISNANSSFIRGVGNSGNLLGIDQFIPNQKINTIIGQNINTQSGSSVMFDVRRKSEP